MPALKVLNKNSLSDKMAVRNVLSTESSDPRSSTIRYIPQLANTQRVPLYTPVTDHAGPCVSNATGAIRVMDAREQAAAHMQPFDVTTADAARQLGRRFSSFIVLDDPTIAIKQHMMIKTGKHNTAGCDTVDFGTWETTTDNAVRACQASVGIHHENIEVR